MTSVTKITIKLKIKCNSLEKLYTNSQQRSQKMNTPTLIDRAMIGNPAKTSKAQRTIANTCMLDGSREARSTDAKIDAFNEMVPWKLSNVNIKKNAEDNLLGG
jgi:hypothetical protein